MDSLTIEYDHEVLKSSSFDNETLNFTPVLMKSINKIIQSEGFVTHSIYGRKISTGGENYMSVLSEVTIRGKTINNEKETNLFIKHCLPENDKNIMSPQDLFLREKFVYTELANVFAELQNEFNVPDAEKFTLIRCYNDDNADSLILENMARQGFKTYNRLDVMPLRAMELSVAQLAKFHAFSIILKEYQPDYYRNKIEKMEFPVTFNDYAINFFTSLCKISIDILEDDKKIIVEKCVPELLSKYARYFNKNESKMKCLCHGDYRMNNILVKEIDGEATTVIPVDFQALYYGSPVIDLLYIIFTSTDKQLRKNEMENLKSIYFESLKKFLQYYKIDVELVYPKTEFEYDFKQQLDYGLSATLILLPLIMVSEDEVPEFDAEIKNVKVHDNFKPRLREIVDDFIQWGYL